MQGAIAPGFGGALSHHAAPLAWAAPLCAALVLLGTWLCPVDAHAQEPSRPAPIERPRPLDVSVQYPADGDGAHTVVVELRVAVDGRVVEASIVSGDEPFAGATLAAAYGFRFEPARRDGEAVEARVRFAVVFTPPEPLLEPSDTAAPVEQGAAEPAASGSPPPEDGFVEVTVSGVRPEAGSSLGQAEIRELPGAFGDAFRALEVLPGVTPIASGLPYFYVRGAPPGNVGYFFDGVRVPVLYHFAAGPAVLHPAFVGQVDLYPGAYPARYGRFAGGILAGEMAEPEYRLRGEASIRLVDSGGMLEVPFAGDRASVMVGGRISYTGLLVSLLVPDLTVTYWDYQSRTRIPIDADDSLELLVFGSGDFVSEKEYDYQTMRREDVTVADIGFHRLDLRWDRALPEGRWRNAFMLGFDRTGIEDGEVELHSYLFGARSELDDRLDSKHRLRAGVDVLLESLGQEFDQNEEFIEAPPPPTAELPPGAAAPMEPGATPAVDPTAPMVDATMPATPRQTGRELPAGPPPGAVQLEDERRADPGDEDFDLGFGDRVDFMAGIYADVVMDVTRDVEFTPGLRVDLFVSRGDVAVGVDPRLRARYHVHPDVALIHALGLAHQMPSFPIPIPGISPSLKGGLQRALQHSAGAELELGGDFLLTSTLFHNVFFGMTDLIGAPGAGENGFRSLGRAYGLEAMLRRPLTRCVSGFASYTLSRSERYLGRYSGPSAFDRSHVLNVALSYDLGRNWRFGNRFMFYTGIPIGLGSEQPDPNRRTPPFYRLDWRLQKRWLYPYGHWGFIAEVLNTTLNKEVVECDEAGCDGEAFGPVTIPSIGVEASF